MRQKYALIREDGAVIFLFALLVTVIFGVAALMIDVPRQEVVVQELQTAADAAALAAATQLNGTEAGWERAELAARRALQDNTVQGRPASELIAGKLQSEWFLRGTYWFDSNPEDGSEPGYKFNKRVEELYASGEQYMGLPAPALAQAVRVNLTLPEFKTTLGRLLHLSSVENMESTATALSNTETTQCVWPIAITACELLKRQEPGQFDRIPENEWTVDEFNPYEQSQRELLFMEPTIYESQQIWEERGIGLFRHLKYPAYPRAVFPGGSSACGVGAGEEGENCHANFIHGILGVHADFTGDPQRSTVATPQELVDYISNGGGCVPVKLGARFLPLQDAVKSSHGLFKDDDVRDALSNQVLSLISESSTSIKDVFGDPRDGTAAVNYPYLRYGSNTELGPALPDRTTVWSPYTSDHKILLGDMARTADQSKWIGSYTYTSPSCHHPGLEADAPDTAPALEVVAMVISSDSDAYCDHYSAENGQAGNYSAVTVDTTPRVVGWTKVVLYDFNFDNLDKQFATTNTPRYPRPHLGGQEYDLVDINPRGIIQGWRP